MEGMLWHAEKNYIKCDLCHIACKIKENGFGACKLRKNEKGRMVVLQTGKIYGTEVENIEKRSLFHFLPNTKTLSILLYGSELNDNFCIDENGGGKVEEISPEEIVELAEKKGCQSISYKITEPTVAFEFAYRIARIARRVNIKNVFISNGLISEEAVKKISKYLDACLIKIKASGDEEFLKKHFAIPSIDPIFSTIKQMRKHRIFVEIVNEIVPQIGDDIKKCRKLAERINAELDPRIPFHLHRFKSKKFPGLPPTPLSLLQKFAEEAKKAGLRYVYISNVPKNPYLHTYCYNCMEKVIIREKGKVKRMNLVGDRCPRCGFKINLVMS